MREEPTDRQDGASDEPVTGATVEELALVPLTDAELRLIVAGNGSTVGGGKFV